MGLEDIIDEKTPDDVKSSSRRSSSSSDDDNKVKIGKPPNQKVFTEERWKEVKKVIADEMDYTISEVLDLPSAEQYKVVHQAATWGEELSEEQKELKTTKECFICGKDARDGGSTTISGKRVHVHHTIGQLDSAMEE